MPSCFDYNPSRADYERDHRDDPDPVPLSAQPAPLSTAMDVAVCVRGMANVHDAAALIERFVASEAQRIRLDAVAAGARP